MIQENVIKKLATNATIFRKGYECFRKGCVKGVNAQRQLSQVDLMAYVQGESTDRVKLSLGASLDRLIGFECTCAQSKAYPGVCKHGIAVMMAYSARSTEELAGEAVLPVASEATKNLALESLLYQYKSMGYTSQRDRQKEEESDLRLVPTFRLSGAGTVSMQVAIGRDKLYTVQNIYQLSEDIEKDRMRTYGKGMTFRHGMQSFEKGSRKLATLIGESGQLGQGAKSDAGEWILSNEAFHQLFKIYKGKEQACYSPFGEEIESIKWEETNPDFKFVIEEAGEQLALKVKEIDLKQLMPVYQGDYILYEQTLYKLDQNCREKVWPLVQVIKKQQGESLLFSPEDLAKIKRIILPHLYHEVDMALSEEKIEAYIPPDLEAKIYLDMPKKSSLTAKIIHQYGEANYNPGLKEYAPEQIRDVYKEQVIQNLLWEYGFDEDMEGAYVLGQESMIYQFVREAIDELTRMGEVYISDKLRQARVRQLRAVSVGVRLQGDWLNIDLGALGIPKEELGRILRAYQAKKKYYRLKNGEFVDLEGEGLEQLESIVEGLNLTDQEMAKQELLVPKYRALYLDKLLKEDKHIRPTRDTGFKTLVQDFEQIEDVEEAVPEALGGILRSYQVTGYRWMKVLGNYGFGGILADDMGLGKTLQMISVLSSQQSESPSLIVCPTSLGFNWQSEFEKFALHMKVLLIQGTQNQREEQIKRIPDYEIIVTSYDSLKRDIEQYSEYMFNYCIIDEAQYIKNSQTQNAKAVKSIKSQRRMALTGTPIENSLSELWSLFDFVMPGYLLSESQFRKEIELPIVRDQDEAVMERLRKMIAPFILRRLKKEVLEELPDKTENVVYSELSEEQYKVYMAYVAKARDELMEQIETEGIEKSQIKMLSCLTRLRQICCHPSLFLENYEGESAKLQTCLELVRSTIESGHKILLFSQFTSMLGVLAEAFTQEGISYSLLKGDVKAEKRREMVENFNTGDTNVFLISLKAGGVGLNLTSADVVIHYDPWWNASAENQATDRAHRIGQVNNVQVFKLIARGTIEEKIKAMQDEKQDLTNNVLSTEQTFINRLSKEDILDLFSLED